MAKIKDKVPSPSQAKDKETKDKGTKETKGKEIKGKSNLVGRVKKVIKKSRRKLGEEKFEKELRRTIEFLAQLQTKIGGNSHGARDNGKALAKVEKKATPKAGAKVDKKAPRNAPKKAQSDKKNGKKTAGNGVGKKRKDAPIKDAASAAESRAALQAEASSTER
jgi:hypothetical protein